MGQTLAEKILTSHSGRKVTAGEITISNVDLCLLQDGTGPLTIRQVEKLGVTKSTSPLRRRAKSSPTIISSFATSPLR
jgi:3-isopropylmalate/(R)-2-methylmalate dehydratase large subunit